MWYMYLHGEQTTQQHLLGWTVCVSGGFYEKDKERLANMMAYGEDVPPPDFKKAIRRAEPEEEPRMDRFEECRSFVDFLKAIGH